jgi:hypothetical protein
MMQKKSRKCRERERPHSAEDKKLREYNEQQHNKNSLQHLVKSINQVIKKLDPISNNIEKCTRFYLIRIELLSYTIGPVTNSLLNFNAIIFN